MSNKDVLDRLREMFGMDANVTVEEAFAAIEAYDRHNLRWIGQLLARVDELQAALDGRPS